MKLRLSSWYSVVSAAVLTTCAAITSSQILVYLLVPEPALYITLQKAPIINVITGLPLCIFVWSQVYKNTLLSVELQRLVNRDRLTDVSTRDFFFACMQGNPDACGVSLMVDIDHFKSVNDRFGHLVGDAVIARVATILRENTRKKDIVCRFGGEEFVIFLHEQEGLGGFQIAERMRQAVADDFLEHEGLAVSFTVSIGGSLKERLQDVTFAIQQADRALYRAKSEGRNKTVFADVLDPRPTDVAA